MRSSLKVTTNKSFLEEKGPDKDQDDPEGALLRFQPIPSTISSDVKAYREVLISLADLEDFEPSVLSSMPVSSVDFEELLEDTLDLQRIADPNLHRIKAVYPPQALSSSSVQDLSPKTEIRGEDRDWQAFMSVIQGAYTTQNNNHSPHPPSS
ncbi:hypothetical protein EON65_56725, partial [archaeon]